jgi:hypothetical protein
MKVQLNGKKSKIAPITYISLRNRQRKSEEECRGNFTLDHLRTEGTSAWASFNVYILWDPPKND